MIWIYSNPDELVYLVCPSFEKKSPHQMSIPKVVKNLH